MVVMVHGSVRGRGRGGVVELGVDASPCGGGGGGGGECVRAMCVCAAVRRAWQRCRFRCRCGMAARVRGVDWQLCDAAALGDVAGISLALLAGADVNVHEGTWVATPLQTAAYNGHVDAVELLLAAGAHVDGANDFGWTPLMRAASKGYGSIVAALVAAGADAHRVSSYGHTALHWACSCGRVDCARALLDAGARTNGCDRAGKRPIDVVRAVLRCAVAVGSCVTTGMTVVVCRCAGM